METIQLSPAGTQMSPGGRLEPGMLIVCRVIKCTSLIGEPLKHFAYWGVAHSEEFWRAGPQVLKVFLIVMKLDPMKVFNEEHPDLDWYQTDSGLLAIYHDLYPKIYV